MEANAEGDNLWLEGTLFPLLRQQTRVRPDDPFLCLSDFVRPLSSGIKDTVGGFATTIDPAMEEEFSHDDYQSLLIKHLGKDWQKPLLKRYTKPCAKRYGDTPRTKS